MDRNNYHAPEWDAKKEKYILKKKSGDGPNTLEFDTQEKILQYFGQNESADDEMKDLENGGDDHQDHVDDLEEVEEDVEAAQDVKPMDQGDEVQKCANKAKKVIKNIYDLYLGENIIDKSEYLVFKKQIDEYNLENLMFQLVANNHLIKKLINQVDTGNLHPRTFEVFSQLQKTNLDILRSQTLHLMNIESNVQKMKENLSAIVPENAEEVQESPKKLGEEDINTTRGQREYMRKLQERVDGEDDEEKED